MGSVARHTPVVMPRNRRLLGAVTLAWLAIGQTAPLPAAGGTQATVPSAQIRDLGWDEQRGGHTLARHVALSDDDLARRLRRERGIAAASTYADRATAERVVGRVLAANRARIGRWIRRGGPRPNLALDYTGSPDAPIGRSWRRGDRRALPCWDAVVVLRWDPAQDYFVLTSYPERRR